MTRPAIDTTDSRSRMVDCQLRPNKVSDTRVLAAMRVLPRERFLPPALAALAYADEDVPLTGGRCLMEPMVLAIAAGTGYGVAVLAACGADVVALEEAEDLLRIARAALAELAPGVHLVSGPLAAGWRAGAPYDLVFIEGGFEQLPTAIAEQVRPNGGRLVGVRVISGRIGQAVLGERAGAAPAISLRPAFDCATPVLPSLRRAPGFVF
jgi:protein-L-isoaspartate(D-aspartate) O-methyltransferase